MRVGRAASSVVALVVLASSAGSSAELSGGVPGAAAGSTGRLAALNGAGNSQADKSSKRSDRLRNGSALFLLEYVGGMVYLEEEHLVNEYTTTNDG